MKDSSKNNENTHKKQTSTHHNNPKLAPEKNADFVQLKDNSLKAIQGLIRKSPVSAQILFFFIEKMGKLNNSVICSYQTLIEVTGYSRPTVGRAIKHLKDKNWISTVKVGSATAYCVNAQVAWRAANNQRHYAIFSSTVVATSSENSEFQTNKKLRYIPHEFGLLVEDPENYEMPPVNIPDQDLIDEINENSEYFEEDPEFDYRDFM